MPKKLWEPSKALIKNSNLFDYEKFISKNYQYNFSKNYKKLLNWSLKNPKDFWNSIWEYFEVKGIKTNKFKLTKDLINSKFFVNSKLNFAENLLAKNSNQKAITFVSENGSIIHNLNLLNHEFPDKIMLARNIHEIQNIFEKNIHQDLKSKCKQLPPQI